MNDTGPQRGIPSTLERAARWSGDVPREADVVVIGGGIAGISTAWELAGRGLKVVLCEKGRVGAEQSGRNWGWIRAQGRDPSELPMMLEARHLWADWAKRLGPPLGHRTCGVTYLAGSEAELAGFEDWLTHARAHDMDSKMLSSAEMAQIVPGADMSHWPGALHTGSDGCAEPFAAVPQMASVLSEAGVVIREACAVRALDIQAGRVTGVITEAGRIACDAVVLCAGAWSSLFLAAHDVRLPQLIVRSTVAATEPIENGPTGAATDPHVAWRKRADGGYSLACPGAQTAFLGPDMIRNTARFLPLLRQNWRSMRFRAASPVGFPDGWRTPRHWQPDAVSPFERQRILDPDPDRKALQAAAQNFARAFPGLGVPKLRRVWAGMIDTMPDVIPVLDHVPELPGLVVGTGLSGHGFGIGPAIGRVLAGLVMQDRSPHDLTRFRLARFRDGSKLRPGPSI